MQEPQGTFILGLVYQFKSYDVITREQPQKRERTSDQSHDFSSDMPKLI